MRGTNALLAVLLLLTIVFASLAFVEHGQVTTITKTSVQTATTVATVTTTAWMTYTTTAHVNGWPLEYISGVSPDGLQLAISLNSTTLLPRGIVRAQIILTNTLSHNVSLAVPPDQNISDWQPYYTICGGGWFMGFALFEGHYSASNVSAAGAPLRLAVTSVPPPCPPPVEVTSVTFLRNSNQYTWGESQNQSSTSISDEMFPETDYCSTSQETMSCGPGPGLIGYWNSTSYLVSNATLASKDFVYFPAGQYTLVATDAWNQFVYAYFVVL
jgi:hypothetical protein